MNTDFIGCWYNWFSADKNAKSMYQHDNFLYALDF